MVSMSTPSSSDGQEKLSTDFTPGFQSLPLNLKQYQTEIISTLRDSRLKPDEKKEKLKPSCQTEEGTKFLCKALNIQVSLLTRVCAGIMGKEPYKARAEAILTDCKVSSVNKTVTDSRTAAAAAPLTTRTFTTQRSAPKDMPQGQKK